MEIDDILVLYALAPVETIEVGIKELQQEYREAQDNKLDKLNTFEDIRKFNNRLQKLYEDINKLIVLRKQRLRKTEG